ncbi:TraB/GumN family protein [Desulfoluna spongiiphila]|uniref:Pheromone shutdown-related protein TraB n=1 Tax=Desulfoluna spongiiphila TaxID=419481 RepID=A0A1G5IQH9_9BACT|nr:TraB/GumN family protein [Desulfoluna spongiiphila]SCY77859.1 pheromone shutdown-related protein TraB [Desulfoluna spongiiphila]VVS92590.1 pheromone shutdown trab bacterial/archaeal [Desulfoluna spongiiphila]
MESTEKNSEMVKRLTRDGKEYLIIGTAHVSRESAELVERVIEEETPDTVCVELCQARYQSMTDPDTWRNMDIIKVIREKKSFLLLANLLLASFQKKVAEKFDIRPGEEMIRAVAKADEVNAELVLADRNVQTTLSRAWHSMGFFKKVSLLFQMLLSVGSADDIEEEEIEKLKNQDMLESVLEDVGKSHPALREILIDERDRYLAHNIRHAAGDKVVAVVGAGHLPGILRYFDNTIDISELDEVPPPGKTGKALKWGLPLLVTALIIYGFSSGGAEAGAGMMGWWIAANGILAGIGAIIAFGHPATVASAVLAAPLTSLNPMVAAGWVSGLVEAFVRKPKVMDFESLGDDILSVKGFWRNKVTRVLLVVVFTNLGSTIGTAVALPMMARILHG